MENEKYYRISRTELISTEQAIGVQPGEDGGVVLLTKKADKANKPASHIQQSTIPAKRSSRKYVPLNTRLRYEKTMGHLERMWIN